ncbi:Methyltransferase domain protein OS=Afipia felis OX=1035 GN=BN961_00553 PE=4 SV=1 [Afipia felis]
MAWIDFYDSAPSIYVSDAHRRAHFDLIATDIIGYIASPEAVVLDYSCGEALSAARVAQKCRRLILAEPAPSVRARLKQRFAAISNIEALSPDDLAAQPDASLDLIVMISVAQYMTPDELDAAFVQFRRLLKPDGRFVLGDILDPDVGAITDAVALLKFAAKNGFLIDAVTGIARMALSDYRSLRQKLGLRCYRTDKMLDRLAAAGLAATLSPRNVGTNPARKTFVARRR